MGQNKSTAKAPRASYHCSECGWEAAKWVGRCGECQAWGTVVEKAAPRSRVQAGPVTAPARPIGEVPIEDSLARSSGVPELDRVLGGGLVPGAAILLAGEPGVGKSTLLLEVAAQTARYRHRVLYITGEESAAQVRMRADRTGAVQDELYLAAETDLGAILGHVEEVKPALLVVDSVQTISAGDVDGVPGGVTQVKEVSAALIRMAKLRNITLVIIGHVTKDGTIAGPRVLEHLVDVVLHFEGERTSRLRMVRAVKNRFGPVDEVGCFDLSAEGIVAITDPTGLFLDARHGPGARHLRRGGDGGSASPAQRGAGAGHPVGGRASPAYDVGGGLRPGGDDPRRPPAARRRPAAQPRRVRLQRRRRPAHRAEQRPRHRAGDHLGLARPAAGSQRRRRSASSASPASCAGSATSACGWPRPAGWASARPSCPPRRPKSAGTSRVLDGLRVMDCDQIARALQLLDLGRDEGAQQQLS